MLGIEDAIPGRENAEIPEELFAAWQAARREMRKTEDAILRHVLSTGQKAPMAFSYRSGLV